MERTHRPSSPLAETVRAKLVPAPASALPHAVRVKAESRFGRDFGDVRVHADERAGNAAEALAAEAFTLGNDIFLARGLDAGTPAGTRLLAHELAHVVQQAGASTPSASSVPPALEASADNAAARFQEGKRVAVRGSSGLAVARQATTARRPAGDVILSALKRGDGTALFVAINATAEELGPAGATALVKNLQFRAELRLLAQGAFLFSILRRLSFPKGAPAQVQQFEDALAARDAAGVLAALSRFPDLRDPERVPGVYETVDRVFRGTREHAQMMQFLSFDLPSVMATAQTSPHFRTLLSLATHFARQSGTTDPLVGKGAEPGNTFTSRSVGVVIQPDVASPQAALTRLTHEVSNAALIDQFNQVYDRRNAGGFSTARQFAEAMVDIEAQSVIARHEIAVDLGVQGDDPVIDGLVRRRRSGALSQAALDTAVTQRVVQLYRGSDGLSAIETYERQFREWQRLQSNAPSRSP